MEKSLEMVCVGPKVERGTVSRNHQAGANGVRLMDSHKGRLSAPAGWCGGEGGA